MQGSSLASNLLCTLHTQKHEQIKNYRTYLSQGTEDTLTWKWNLGFGTFDKKDKPSLIGATIV